ncbi:TetR family transcriptional regulator [Aeromicrobium endophyticum]|uniref:TetR/AcrR family transcriptional regulator n=1 Tax=Aeromicrobium endophyticum TaxID=2292704 RepID=A0A371PDA1_9ACTN|nr:TetR family transcriptional regulator [Aeromicrobium endophyticum]REK73911.1 TetR/AcrR family transcriptional regulator [Aeromicrobium endophyticum]
MTSDLPVPVRQRLLDAAQAMIEAGGWAAVTMSGVASSAGVSRQTAYNEFGTKHGLAQQLALRELQLFLTVARTRMEAERDLSDGIRAACEGVLLMGEQSLLVRTIVSSAATDRDLDFLMILTTESGGIVETAVAVVEQAVAELYPPSGFEQEQLGVVTEAVVRLVLSGLTRPSKAPADAAADIGWLVGMVLAGAAAAA